MLFRSVGCDNEVSKDYLAMKQKQDPSKDWKNIYGFTFCRTNEGIGKLVRYGPRHVSYADASGGSLALPPTFVNTELRMIDKWWEKVNGGIVSTSV